MVRDTPEDARRGEDWQSLLVNFAQPKEEKGGGDWLFLPTKGCGLRDEASETLAKTITRSWTTQGRKVVSR